MIIHLKYVVISIKYDKKVSNKMQQDTHNNVNKYSTFVTKTHISNNKNIWWHNLNIYSFKLINNAR